MTREVDRDGLQKNVGDRPLPDFNPKPSIVTPKAFPLKESRWNTNHLPWRVTSDFTAAACASGLVSPLITIIDR